MCLFFVSESGVTCRKRDISVISSTPTYNAILLSFMIELSIVVHLSSTHRQLSRFNRQSYIEIYIIMCNNGRRVAKADIPIFKSVTETATFVMFSYSLVSVSFAVSGVKRWNSMRRQRSDGSEDRDLRQPIA